MKKAGNRVVRATIQRLESLQRAGVTHVGKVRRTVPPSQQPEIDGSVGATVALSPRGGSATATPTTGACAPTNALPGRAGTDERAAALAAVARRVAACTRCAELARTRTQTVFGVGNPHARLVFLGEAPGADEDRQGEPFVGAAGQLLDKIIAACTLRREDVYIMNILRCRPPANRAPLPVEAAACREYLDAQLSIIQPEFICCLGAVAAQNLLHSDATIGRLRGRFHDYRGIKVICTYHPAYLLRTPPAKRAAWDDMQMLMAAMGIKLPAKAQGGDRQ